MSAGIASGSARAGTAKVGAWDAPTRIFKWSLVTLLLVSYLTYLQGDAGMRWHIWSGYAVLVLLVFRLIWGFVGSSTARFASWVTWPWTALAYGLKLLQGRSPRFLGHNPLGGWMILLLVVLVASQGVAGLFTVDNNGLQGGPFANLDFGDPTPTQRTLSRWHHLGFYVIMGVACIHVLANVWYQSAKGDPLITGMVTGEKPAADYADEPAMRPASNLWLRAAGSLAAAAAIVFGGVKAFGGTLPF